MPGIDLAEKVAVHDTKLESLEHRVGRLETTSEKLEKINLSIKELSINMNNICEEQKKTSEKLDALEKEPLEDFKHYKKVVIGAILTTIVGLVIGYLVAKFL